MTAESITIAGRTAAEELMVETCTIRRHAKASFTAGAHVPGAAPTVYSGKCQVQITDALDTSTPVVGDRQVSLQRVTVKVPVAALGVRVDDVITIDTATLDPSLVNRRYRVVADHSKSFATARRFQAVQIIDGTDT